MAGKGMSNRKFFLLVGSIIAIGLIVLVGGNSLIKRASCTIYGKSLERETQYSMFVGCKVKTESGWALRSEIRSAGN